MKKLILMFLVLIVGVSFSFEVVFVERVVDGDTLKIEINDKIKTIRLCGVDTPESVKPGTPIEPGAIEASNFSKNIEGKFVVLTYDSNSPDFFGRILGYIWVEVENGQLICWNIELIKQGYSEFYTKYKFDGYGWIKKSLNNF